MRALGFEVKKVDVLKILKDYDREGNGKITFEDFNEVGEFAFGSAESVERDKYDDQSAGGWEEVEDERLRQSMNKSVLTLTKVL